MSLFRSSHTQAGFLLGILSLSVSPGVAATLHVSPAGNDAWSGTAPEPNADKTDGPLASLQGARDALRKLRAARPLAESVRILLAEGIYSQEKPLVLEPQDSGTEQAPITYEAVTKTRPVFSGGRQISGFTAGPDGTWIAKVRKDGGGTWQFEQLFVRLGLAP